MTYTDKLREAAELWKSERGTVAKSPGELALMDALSSPPPPVPKEWSEKVEQALNLLEEQNYYTAHKAGCACDDGVQECAYESGKVLAAEVRRLRAELAQARKAANAVVDSYDRLAALPPVSPDKEAKP